VAMGAELTVDEGTTGEAVTDVGVLAVRSTSRDLPQYPSTES
jgi:hypothetical protein